jgi:EAL domain-containing protein (putative c-di-GMP-specific phosphodiesterase class I)
VAQALADAQLEAGALTVEITESLLMSDPERAQQVVTELHAMGLQVAIDDFGTGFSSLAYLKHFPVQVLKLDRSFIRGLPSDRGDAAITQAVVAMAHRLNMRVVAEGVETQAQLRFLRHIGCDVVQGYFTGRPLAPEVLSATVLASGLACLDAPT